MLIEFTTNVQARMQDRDIAESDIRAVLEAPDHLSQSFESRWRAKKRIRERCLEVLFLREPMHQQVITAYWVET